MSMTPYEIRLELLKMAKDMLTDDFHSKRQTISEAWHTQIEAAKIAGTPSPDAPVMPNYPTESDIITKAQVLNDFVSQTPTPHTEIKTKKSNS
jgi:hypothetical protein